MSFLRCFLFLLFFCSWARAEGLPQVQFSNAEGTLFTMQGSNTIGARLGPALVKGWLEARGFQSVTIQDTATANEQQVTGHNQKTGRTVTVEVKAHGSSSGFKAMLVSQADVAAASRRIKDKELVKLADYGDMRSSSSEWVAGIDGIAVIVNPANGISRLNTDDVARIFSGEITNWVELGGKDLPIVVYARDDQSGTWDTFRNLVLGKQYQLTEAAERFESNAVLSGRVAEDPAAIGFVSLNTIGQSKALAIASGKARSLAPQHLTVATEDYALARRLYLYLPAVSPNGYAQDFLQWAAGEDGQAIVDEVGYISQNVKPLQAEVQDAPDDYQALVMNSQRLSVNFRFEGGKAVLDNKAFKDIERLARFMEKSPGQLTLIGFAENDGSDYAELLSELRAKVVRRALIRAGVSRKQLELHGYGEYLHLADGDDQAANVKNRRVEVWFQPAA
ncbi:substrate-binding domain-containing protein [Parendozoicomonas haliclonae]|uniref:Phosphate-binding protein PstS n=1 Tax=Parendozoicomonas haliclonae TaxID=1960125 RepID=A0A1X7AKF3_9GAMM|nr:phosphate ABC transporter substrate-binding/OmpA family protein [Parendozoicomonas haliclonae]SMA43696.1 Phosphate-binding protein PstS precursor [Parendozoicomonas haliclonae]